MDLCSSSGSIIIRFEHYQDAVCASCFHCHSFANCWPYVAPGLSEGTDNSRAQ